MRSGRMPSLILFVCRSVCDRSSRLAGHDWNNMMYLVTGIFRTVLCSLLLSHSPSGSCRVCSPAAMATAG